MVCSDHLHPSTHVNNLERSFEIRLRNAPHTRAGTRQHFCNHGWLGSACKSNTCNAHKYRYRWRRRVLSISVCFGFGIFRIGVPGPDDFAPWLVIFFFSSLKVFGLCQVFFLCSNLLWTDLEESWADGIVQ